MWGLEKGLDNRQVERFFLVKGLRIAVEISLVVANITKSEKFVTRVHFIRHAFLG